MAWYNKYRPGKFEDVIGQDLIKSVLQNALKKNRIKHAYLFSGGKGIGKTTLARIFASSLNDLENNLEAKIDIVEMDAASNTGIDDVRQLIESAKNPPIIGKYKIYIIDEVHMLSKPAMNALLKILEEPPQYLIFLLATTNPEKLIPTVLSRLTKLNLGNHTQDDLVKNLKYIAGKESFDIDELSLRLIAKRSGGSQRDAINLLETVASYELDKYDIQSTTKLLGLVTDELLLKTASSLLEGTVDGVLVNELEHSGIDVSGFLNQLLEYLLDRSFYSSGSLDKLILPLSEVISLNLPINSVVSAMAILQVKLKESGYLVSSKSVSIKQDSVDTISDLINDSPLPGAPEVSTPEPAPDPKISAFDPSASVGVLIQETNIEMMQSLEPLPGHNSGDTDQISQSDFRGSSPVEPVVEIKSDLSEEKTEVSLSKNDLNQGSIFGYIKSLTSESDSPPILKMIMQDLHVESVIGNKLKLTASNGIFLAQLNSPKLQGWILNKLNLEFNTSLQIETSLRSHKKDPVSKLANAEIIESNQAKIVVDSTKNKTQEKPKYFYSIYGAGNGLPEQIKQSDLPIVTESVKAPVINDDWDKHAGELFDFED